MGALPPCTSQKLDLLSGTASAVCVASPQLVAGRRRIWILEVPQVHCATPHRPPTAAAAAAADVAAGVAVLHV